MRVSCKNAGLFLFMLIFGTVVLFMPMCLTSCIFSSEENIVFYRTGEDAVEIERTVNRNLPYGEVFVGKSGRVYGAIYPYSLELSEADGFAASIVHALYSGTTNATVRETGEYLSLFNWSRFIEECRKLEDPWKLDRDKIIRHIASGCFSKSDLK